MPKKTNFKLEVLASEITTEAKEFSLTADAEDIAQITERLNLVSLQSASADIQTYYNRDKKAIVVSGHVQAELAQTCVVTLEPVPEIIDEGFELLLVSPDQAAQFDADEVYLDPEKPDYDSLEGDTVSLSEIVVQSLSMMMTQYPRKSDVALETEVSGNVEVNKELEKKPNPFEALAKLRDES